MKSLKFSFALVAAVIAIGFTVASNAMGKRVITGCFTTVTLADASDANQFTPVNDETLCLTVESIIIMGNVVYITDTDRFVQDLECEIGQDFCCVEVEEVPSAGLDSDLATDLGEGDKFYKVVGVNCKP